MTTTRGRARAVMTMIVAAAMTATMVSRPPVAAATAAGWAELVPTAAQLHEVAAVLPDEPVAAAEHLVELVWGDDSLVAVAATGEILRRAGLPLVSADGPVVALPDGHVIHNAPILVEFLPTLTDAVRGGAIYPPEQVAELLEFVGFTAAAPSPREVVGLLAAWGKAGGDMAETRHAGITVRALARARGQLLIPASVPTADQAALLAEDPSAIPDGVLSWLIAPTAVRGIDPISTVLLLAHAAGEVAERVTVTSVASGLRGTAGGALRAGAGPGCEDILPEPESRAGQEAEGAVKEAVKSKSRDAVGKALEDAGARVGKKGTERAGEGYDKLTDAVSVLLLLLGAKLDLDADKERTHFRHGSGDRSGDVTFTATASFESALAKRHLRCWSLVGIEVPPDGPLKGYTVRWRLSSEPQVFQAFSESRDKFAKGDVTGEDGVSTISIYPRTELSPPSEGEAQPEITLSTTVFAALDKDDFPWKLSDLIDIADSANLGIAAAKALYNLLLSLVKRGALPTKSHHLPVSYHGQMPFVAVGEMQASASIAAISVDFRADLYSCTGPLGPWQGTAGSGGNVSITHTGSAPQVVGGGQADFPLRFELAETNLEQRFHIADAVGLQIELDIDAVKKVLRPKRVLDMYDSMRGTPVVVGTGTWTLEGQEVARGLGGSNMMTWAAGSETFDLVSRASDDRCGGSSYWANQRFDRTERG